MSREKSNITKWSKKQRCLLWAVEWVLPDGSLHIKECSENRPISTLYAAAFPTHPAPGSSNRKSKRQKRAARVRAEETAAMQVNGAAEGEDDDDHEVSIPSTGSIHVDEFLATSTPSLCFHLHSPALPSSKKVVSPLSSNATLAESLRNRLVLEFPTIYVFDRRRQTDGQQDSPDLPLESSDFQLPDGFTTESAYYASSSAFSPSTSGTHHISSRSVARQQWNGTGRPRIEEISAPT